MQYFTHVRDRDRRDLIYCVTGGGIHPVAQRIADLTGGKVFDGFRSSAPEKQIACVVIDCGGTARIGVYPMKRLPTIDVKASSPSGPLIQFIKEDIFVSGVNMASTASTSTCCPEPLDAVAVVAAPPEAPALVGPALGLAADAGAACVTSLRDLRLAPVPHLRGGICAT